MDLQTRRIYLDYCEKMNLKPREEILDIAENRVQYCRIRRLDEMGDIYLQENDIFSLCLVLSQNLPNFTELEISNHILNASYMSMISSAVRTNHTLRKLVLVNNVIDDQGAQTLAIALQDNPNIRELNLSHNRIKNTGAEAISLAVFSNSCLIEKVNLSRNMIEEDYFGPILESKQTLVDLDISFNHYSIDSIENLLKGASKSVSLKVLHISGMKGTVNLNAIALSELITLNQSINEISIDMDLELLDENMIIKLEDALLENISLYNIKAQKFDISLNNPSTAMLFKLLKSNEWIIKNYERLCRNELVDCHEMIEEIVKTKLELLTKRIKHNDQILISENITIHTDQPSTEYFPLKASLSQDLHQITAIRRKDFSENPSFHLSKSMDIGSLEDTNTNEKIMELQRKHNENKIFLMTEQIENNLFFKLRRAITDEINNHMSGVHNQLKNISNRVDKLEEKVNNVIQKKDLGISENTLPKRTDTKSLQIENQNILDKAKYKPSPLLSTEREHSPVNIESRRVVLPTESEGYFEERANFEKTAKTNFNDIFQKLNDLTGLIGHLIENQGGDDYEKAAQQPHSDLKKEQERLERMISDKMDQIFTSRLKNLESSLNGGYTNLKSTLYETQNRLKDLEYCVLENADINYNDFKKKLNKSQDLKATVSQSTKNLKQSQINPNNLKVSSQLISREEENRSHPHEGDHVRPSSPRDRRDDPLSLKELQATPQQNYEVRHTDKGNKQQSKQNFKDQVLSNLPDSIRKVKEDIKKKIENYRAAISPYKQDRESARSHMDTKSPMTKKSRSPFRESMKTLSKTSTNTKEVPTGNLAPSEELVQILKRRGFTFSDI